MVFGTGDYTYEVVEGWGGGDDGRSLGVVSSMAVDSQDRVHVIDREPNPAVVVYDRTVVSCTTGGRTSSRCPIPSGSARTTSST